MTTEERLVEIRANANVNACPGCTCPEVRELLELVALTSEATNETINTLLLEKAKAQGRPGMILT